MPNIKSAVKRMRQNARRRNANRSNRAAMRTAVKKFNTAAQTGDAQATSELLQPTISVIGKSAQKGLIHKNNAARHISRLTKRANALAAQGNASSEA